MSNPLTHTDTLPWYRQFWPWFLFALPGTVVIAALATLYIANRHADDLVVDDYYKEGLAINQRLEKQENARLMGVTAKLAITADQATVTVTGPVSGDTLRLQFSHPLESDQDFTLSLQRISDSQFRGTLPNPVAQRWHWSLQDSNQTDWRINGAVTAADFRYGPGN